MTTFTDLSEYRHMIEPYSFRDVLNVGWIDPRASFPKGIVSDSIKDVLLNLAFGQYAAKSVIEPSRELPACPACGKEITLERNGKVLTDAELWVPGMGKTYASPILVVHYIEAHNYLPPQEFLEALERLLPDTAFDGEALYREKLRECGWFANQFKKS